MQLKAPFSIGSNLLPTLTIGDGSVSLEFACYDDDRDVYEWTIDIPAGSFSRADLRSGAGGADLQSMFGTLLSFLGAAAESYRYTMSGRQSDNSDLFPPEVMEWAYCNADEISMAQLELEETADLIEE